MERKLYLYQKTVHILVGWVLEFVSWISLRLPVPFFKSLFFFLELGNKCNTNIDKVINGC